MTYPTIINGVEQARDVVIVCLACYREQDGDRVPISSDQKDAAMNAAKQALTSAGVEVLDSSTAIIIPPSDSPKRLTIDVEVEDI